MASPRSEPSSEDEDWDNELENDEQIEEAKDGAAVYTMQSVNGMVTITPVQGNVRPDSEPVEVEVDWPADDRTSEVSIFTSFDDFETPVPLGAAEDALGQPIFQATLKLPPGRYLVRYEVDGEWAVDESEDVIYSLGNEYNALVIQDPNAPLAEFDESSEDSGSDWDVEEDGLRAERAAEDEAARAESIRSIVAAVNQSVPDAGGSGMLTITPDDFRSVSKELDLSAHQRASSVVWDPARQAFVMGGARGHSRRASAVPEDGDDDDDDDDDDEDEGEEADAAAAAGAAAGSVVQAIPDDATPEERAAYKKEKEREKRRRKKRRRKEKKRQKRRNRHAFAVAGAVRPRGTGARNAGTDQAWLRDELARREKEWREAWILHELKSEERREAEKAAMREQWKGERDIWISKVQNYSADNNALRDQAAALQAELDQSRRGGKLADADLERKHAAATAEGERLAAELEAARAELAQAREGSRAAEAAALEKGRGEAEARSAAERDASEARAAAAEAALALQAAQREAEAARADAERLRAERDQAAQGASEEAAAAAQRELDAARAELDAARAEAASSADRLKAAEAAAAASAAEAERKDAAARELEAAAAASQQARLDAEAGAEARRAELERKAEESRQAAAAARADADRLTGELEAAAGAAAAAAEARERDRAEYERKLAESRQTQAGLGKALRALSGVAQALRGDVKAVRDAASRDSAVIQTELAENTKFLAQSLRLQSDLLRSTMQKYKKELSDRRKYFNMVQELRGNIRVFCRSRPMLPHDAKKGSSMSCVFPDTSTLTVKSEKRGDVAFEFDRVFAPDSTQLDVFAETRDLVTSCMDGYNVCIFAYGQTGSGKTHTMAGSKDDRGVNFRALSELFRLRDARAEDFEYDISVNMVEIYNEQLRDLLNKDPVGSASSLKVHKGANGIYVENLTEWDVQSPDDVLRAIAAGDKNRSQGVTNMNEHSSRSHALVTVKVVGKHRTAGISYFGKLHMIDLAGSERISKSGATGQRLKEAQAINKSLSALGNVIESLQKKQSHVPYRDSKLTYLLQDSLGGNSKCLMIAAMSPTDDDTEETISTLKFAERARKVELGPTTRTTKRAGGGDKPKRRSKPKA